MWTGAVSRPSKKAGFDDCFFEPRLDKIILVEMGLDDGIDETMERYYAIIEKRSKKIDRTQESVMRQAWKAHRDLMKINQKLAP
jgi:hypothetical protein